MTEKANNTEKIIKYQESDYLNFERKRVFAFDDVSFLNFERKRGFVFDDLSFLNLPGKKKDEEVGKIIKKYHSGIKDKKIIKRESSILPYLFDEINAMSNGNREILRLMDNKKQIFLKNLVFYINLCEGIRKEQFRYYGKL